MKVSETSLPGVLVVEPHGFEDARGHFFESYHFDRYRAAGIPDVFVQDNESFSRKGVLRGLHYQLGRPQSKLLRVIRGEIFDVAVDIRRDSPHFGRWCAVVLSGENRKQLYIPKGFAHGYCATSDEAWVEYRCSDYYAPAEERGIRWDDPDLAIAWPVREPILSPRDAALPHLRDANLPART